ncbi:hypothetical protein BDR26DRAFT_868897 [Obelidium mucronatum]|nr:hypothetical protein BDR26DRAFT_868897 [Obelidium mucronatum]
MHSLDSEPSITLPSIRQLFTSLIAGEIEITRPDNFCLHYQSTQRSITPWVHSCFLIHDCRQRDTLNETISDSQGGSVETPQLLRSSLPPGQEPVVASPTSSLPVQSSSILVNTKLRSTNRTSIHKYDSCSLSFTRRFDMGRHEKSVHSVRAGNALYSCECGKEYGRLDSWRRHSKMCRFEK